MNVLIRLKWVDFDMLCVSARHELHYRHCKDKFL